MFSTTSFFSIDQEQRFIERSIGKFQVKDKHNYQYLSAYIFCSYYGDFAYFSARLFNTKSQLHELIGSIALEYIKSLNPIKKGNEKENQYYKHTDAVGFICINTLDSNGEYRGVGTALMQVAIEYSFLKGCLGRIQLESIDDSCPFYYNQIKMSFIEDHESLQERIKNIHKRSSVNYGSHDMYLSEESIQEWKTKILFNPILQTTKEQFYPASKVS